MDLVRRELEPRDIPVIGFAGAPFTLASYAIEGGASTERALLRDIHALMDEADIIVASLWNDPVDVFMDGAFRFPLGYKESGEIDNVSRSTHLLEARSRVTGEVVAQKELAVSEKTNYTWTIDHRARINCANSFGETLKIFMDGIFQFDLADKENRWLIDVALGNHFLAAYKTSDGKEAASITLKVTENKDYGWAISVIEGGSPVVITGH